MEAKTPSEATLLLKGMENYANALGELSKASHNIEQMWHVYMHGTRNTGAVDPADEIIREDFYEEL